MDNNNSPDNWVPVKQSSQTATVADDNWVKVDSDHQGATPYDHFKETPKKDMTDQELEDQGEGDFARDRKASQAKTAQDKGNMTSTPESLSSGHPDANKGHSRGVTGSLETNPDVKEGTSPSGKKYNTVSAPDYPPEDWLNATYHIGIGMVWQNYIKPVEKAMGQPTKDMDEYVAQLEKKHPIATVVGGTAPFLVTAPFLPESLLPNVYARTAAQFGLVGLGAGINKAQDMPKETPLPARIGTAASETIKQAAYSPIYAKAQALQILDRPFASALARAGVITTGSGVMNMVFGDNVVEAFKQAGVYGVLSLLAESPHLAGTTIARGVAAHVNNLRAQRMVNAGILDQAPDNIAVKGPVGNWPVIDPDSPDVASQAHDAAVAMAKDVPGIDKPQIASATIRLIDGTERTYIGAEIHGTSHEEALEKIGKKKAPEGEEINIPEFKGTEDAIKFGESNKDNPAVLQEMHKRLDELRAKNKDMNERYADLSVDEEKALAGNVLKAQLYNEALKSADKTPEALEYQKQTELLEKSKDIINIIDWERNQSKGEKLSFVDEEGKRQWIGSTSGHSEAMQAAAKRNGSYDKVYEILEKYLSGEKLTDLQNKDVESIITDYRKNIKKGLEDTLKGIEDAKKQLTESETKEVIDAFKKEEGLSDVLWQEQEQASAEHTPSGQLRHELQAPIPGDLFQEKGELFEERQDDAHPPTIRIKFNFSITKQNQDFLMKASNDKDLIEIADKSGLKDVTVQPPYVFTQLSEEGHFNPKTGEIELNPNAGNIVKTFYHELAHRVYELFTPQQKNQALEIINKNESFIKEKTPGYVGDIDESWAELIAEKNPEAIALAKQVEYKADKFTPAIEEKPPVSVKKVEIPFPPENHYLSPNSDIDKFIDKHGDYIAVVKDMNNGRHVLPLSMFKRWIENPLIDGHIKEVWMTGKKAGEGKPVLDAYTLSGLPTMVRGILESTPSLLENLKDDEGGRVKQMVDKLKSGKVYQAGFTDTNGKFITREESKQEPYNLPNGHSEDVKGLNESKFMKPPEDIKIVNPDTLKKIADNEGKIDINMIPLGAEIPENLSKLYEEYKKNIEPIEVSKASQFTAADLRDRLGRRARLLDQLTKSLLEAQKFFAKATKESITDTYTRAQNGEAQDTPQLQKYYDTLIAILEDEKARVRAINPKLLQHAIENYLPQIWERPGKAAVSQIIAFFSRKPFEGTKSFLKMRKIDDFAAGIEAGLTPVSWNPVDLTLLKVREIEKYVLAHGALNANIERGLAQYVAVGAKAPEGWKQIDDRISTIYKSPMIPISEAFDADVMGGLNKIADALKIPMERRPSIGGKRLGYAQRGVPAQEEGKYEPGKVVTKFATPEEVLAHEIGHQIDWIYGMKEKMFGGTRPKADFILDKMITKAEREGRNADVDRMKKQKVINKELRDLGDATEGPAYWRRKSSEKMAIMVGSLIHAPQEFERVAPNSYKMFTDIIKADPKLKALMDIKPSLKLPEVGKSEVYAGGLVISGHIYAHLDTARIINNYLSPGLRGNYVFDLYRGTGNNLVQARLGLSAFHGFFTSMDSMISKTALGLNYLSKGKVKEAGVAWQSFIPGLVPVTNFMEGRNVAEAWYGKDKGQITNFIAEMYAAGGGRAKMDQFYATSFDKEIAKALKEGKYVSAALRVPFEIIRQISRPLMEYTVPRMKMGIFSDIMKMEISDNPNMSYAEFRAKAQKAVDSVDNRMGQLVYDNLMINRGMKDLGMASVQSLGWNIGTIRELVGGHVDLIKSLNDLRKGKPTELSYRTAYLMAMPLVVGYYGMIYQYLHTGLLPGQGHEEEGFAGRIKDFFNPRNGGIDKNGQESRTVLASYMKDVFAFTSNAPRTVVNKLNPLNSMLIEMWQNKDYYGTQIRNDDDGYVQQAIDVAKFIGTGYLPYSFTNQARDTRTGLEARLEPFFGMTPARYDVNMTEAEKTAYELGKSSYEGKTRTKEQAQHSKDRAKLRSQYMADKDEGPLQEAVDNKVISRREKKEIIKEASQTNLQRLTRNLTYEEVFHILNKGKPNDKEKEELQDILEKKKANKEKAGRWTSDEEDLYARSIELEK